MADTEVEITTAPTQTLADGGDLPTFADLVDFVPRRQPVAEIAAAAALAETAIQSGTLGSAAGADVEDFMLRSEHDAIVSGLQARLAILEARVGGAFGYPPFETGIFETGIYEE